MSLTPQQIARAFSEHHFELVYPYLLEGVAWNNVGGEQITGKDAVIQTCTASAQYLQAVTTAFKKFNIIAGDAAVVVDSLADYTDAEGAVVCVASCDIYQFVDGQVSTITSYTVEIKPESAQAESDEGKA